MLRLIEWLLIITIVGSVLAFGAVQAHVYFLMVAAIFLALLLVLVQQTRAGTIALPLPVWVVPFLIWTLMQVIPLPTGMVAWFSPLRAQLARSPLPDATAPNWLTLSIYPGLTLAAAGKLLAYVGAFALAALLFDSTRRHSLVLRALIILGCFQAGYGMVQYLAGYQKIFGYVKRYYTAEATGTYINRNHYAGFLEMITPLVVAQVFYYVHSWGRVDDRTRVSTANPRAGMDRGKVAFYTFLAVFLVVGLIFSTSRMGILTAVLCLLLMGFLGRLRVRRRVWSVVSLLILGGAVFYALWIGLDPVLRRYEALRGPGSIESEGRVGLWKSQVPLIKDYALTGTGLGTFRVAFRRYQETHLENVVTHAHNDYLEIASETGIIGLTLLLVPLLYLWVRMVLVFLRDSNHYRRAILLGCLGSSAAILIHGSADFNLQIPANALVFATVLGIGYKVACVEPGETKAEVSRRIGPAPLSHPAPR